jgi:pyrrolidone-carboxylate peptidase
LWQKACADLQSNLLDDRSLYWGRLLLTKTLYDHNLETLVPVVEQASRNLGPLVSGFEPQAILTGFDPFGLNTNVQQCNPSGAFALALNGTKIGDFRVKSMIFPVRYADFDDFCIENTFQSILNSDSVALVVTVSMGREGFDLERFPAKCRGSSQPDNQDIVITQLSEPFEPLLDGPSFLEFSLPAEAMLRKLSADTRARVSDKRHVTTIEDGAVETSSLSSLASKHAISGSGGNFLSNEISYRALNLQSKLGASIPMGHIHVPRVLGYVESQVRRDFALFKEMLSVLVSLVPSSPNSSSNEG